MKLLMLDANCGKIDLIRFGLKKNNSLFIRNLKKCHGV